MVWEGGTDESETTNNIGHDANGTEVCLCPPDLVGVSIEAPQEGLASQDLVLSFTVTNSGDQSTPESTWTDTFYLSSDAIFDAGVDLNLGRSGLSRKTQGLADHLCCRLCTIL